MTTPDLRLVCLLDVLIQILALAGLCRGARLSPAAESASFAEVAVPPGSLAAPAARGGSPL